MPLRFRARRGSPSPAHTRLYGDPRNDGPNADNAVFCTDRTHHNRKKDAFAVVAALSLIDANSDGYVTLDETLLTPDKFKRFDADGDGKISSIEFVDLRSFDTIDGNRDGSVTFEEYLSFVRATAR